MILRGGGRQAAEETEIDLGFSFCILEATDGLGPRVHLAPKDQYFSCF